MWHSLTHRTGADACVRARVVDRFGDDGSCYYTTSAASITADAACSWPFSTASILTSGLGIEFSPSESEIIALWDGSCKEEGGDPALHPTCTGPAACVSGWEGVRCDTDIDDCLSFPCEDHLECFDLGTNAFECRCVGGWGGMCTQPVSMGHRQTMQHAKFVRSSVPVSYTHLTLPTIYSV